MNEPLKLLTAISLSVFLTACGGGGSSDDDDTAPATPPAPAPPGQISGGEGSVTEDNQVSTSGQLIDDTFADQIFEESDLQGKYGHLKTSSEGSWSYTLKSELADPLNADESTKDLFSVGVGGGDDTTEIIISITGADDAYTFDPGSPLATMVVDSRAHAEGTLTIEDIDGNTPEFVKKTISASYGEFKISPNGDWEYSLNNTDSLKKGETSKDTILFKLTDGVEQSVVFSVATIDPSESSIVFILMNFSDGLATDQADLADIANTVFNDVDSLDNAYLKNSLGQLKFLRHRINDKSLQHYCYGEPGNEETSLDCVIFNIPDTENGGTLSIENAAARAGQDGEYTDGGFKWRDKAYQWAKDNLVDENGQALNLRDWRHQVFIYPHASYRKRLVGLGIAGVEDSWSLVASSSDQNVMGHELGHNIGLGHAGLDLDNDGDAEDAYGTGGSLMGNRRQSRLFGSAHREYMGWLNLFPETTGTVKQLANTNQDVEIQAIELTAGELSGTLPQQLKVESAGSKNGENHYYINYHISHDILNPRSHFEGSVTVHYLKDRVSNHVAVLKQPGESFSDDKIGLNIEFKSRNNLSQSAVISVSYNQ